MLCAEYFLGIAGQQIENIEFLGRQLHIVPEENNGPAVRINNQSPGFEHRFLFGLRLIKLHGTAQLRVHPGDQLHGIKRLGHIIVGSDDEAGDFIQVRGFGA
ncbi:hypothetical protein D3C75_1081390 [compost metagenome]